MNICKRVSKAKNGMRWFINKGNSLISYILEKIIIMPSKSLPNQTKINKIFIYLAMQQNYLGHLLK